MTFEPMNQIITEIGQWGKKNGARIIEAFYYEGDWSGWAQVELALYFKDFGNVTVSRNQPLGPDGTTADLLLSIAGGKNVAIKLVCEMLPPKTNAQGDDEIWSKINKAYLALEKIRVEDIRPVAMGIVVSNIANDSARYNLCDKNLFDSLLLFTSKTGPTVNLYFRWV